MKYNVNTAIEFAKKEVGYIEKRSNFMLYDKTANAGTSNYTKYGAEMHSIYPEVMDFPAPWCDAFVDWCFSKAYGIANAKGLLGGNFNDYTVASAQLYKNKNAYYKSNPRVGDQVFFKNSKGKICHTGLVYHVDAKYVYTIEGNTSSSSGVVANGGCVREKSYSLSYSRIDGYGRPKYSDDNVHAQNPYIEPTKTIYKGKLGMSKNDVKWLQFELGFVGKDLDGIWGNMTNNAFKKWQLENPRSYAPDKTPDLKCGQVSRMLLKEQ